MNCQICFSPLGGMSVQARELHYETHFQDSESQGQSGSSSKPYGVLKPSSTLKSSSDQQFNSKSSPKKRWKSPMKMVEDGKDVFWYPSLRTIPPHNFVPCMIPLLKKSLLKSHAKGTTARAVLCHDRALYIRRQAWDMTWGCGYRNFMMTCASLLNQQIQPEYISLLEKPISPGVRNLQKWIEAAWNDGFDKQGFDELKKLSGTSKWIGTSGSVHTTNLMSIADDRVDLCTAFVYRGIPAELVDIDTSERGITPLINWIIQYFDKHLKGSTTAGASAFDALKGASPVQCTPCMPVIVQNNGHSRTVVGYERTKNNAVNLLVFDPARVPSNSIRRAALAIFNSSSSWSSLPQSNSHQSQKRRSADSPLASSSKSNSTHKRHKKEHITGGEKDRDVTIMNEDQPIVLDSESDDEVVFVSETKASGSASQKFSLHKGDEEPSYTDVLKLFRWENKIVKKQNIYQILYFPMTAPLTDKERRDRKVLTGERY
ncbi:hypothetical protein VKT23_017160 [Stygiomarasmius scandens]|uniref:UFSP1/2/DUB catalytic domain-containing protein n=1 Tax=Marasmiellus scandens TaxID=2682957 RepID=A0ABR1ISW3_9AGAR